MEQYNKYRWFYTSSGKKVVGGKSATQNDELLKEITSEKEKYYVMHTSSPGSPFSVILAKMNQVTEKDLEECAVFTGCFSKEWKAKKKEARIDIFISEQLSKDKEMKEGMWRVKGEVKHKTVKLELVLIKQKGILRAVPGATSKKFIVKIIPGNIEKQDALIKIQTGTSVKLDSEQFLSAIPAGGIKII